MGSRIIIVLFLAFLLLICPYLQVAHAQEKLISVDPMKSTAFTFTLENKKSEPAIYTMFIKGWYLWLFLRDSQVLFEPSEKKDLLVVAAPSLEISPGAYPIEIISESKFENTTTRFLIDVAEIKGVTKPRNEVKSASFDRNGFRLVAYSDQPLNISVGIFRDGELVDSFFEALVPGEIDFSKEIEFDSGNYTARYILYRGEEIFDSGEKLYESPFVSKIKTTESEDDKFFWSVTTVTFVSEGDKTEKKTYKVGIEKFVEPFFSSSEKYTRTQVGDSAVYVWEFYLNAGQTKTFTYTYNYSYPTIAIIIVIAAAIILFLLTRKEVGVRKFFTGKTSHIKSEADMKICIEISNRTGRQIKDLTLEDYVQPIFRIKKSFEGVNPSGFYRKGDDVKIAWKIPALEPRETRMFTYTIVPKVGLGGKYSFSTARLTYKVGKVKKTVVSNELLAGI